MFPRTVIEPASELYQALQSGDGRTIVVFAGLPGTGKSLFTSSAAAVAAEASRQVTLLQWDVARASFVNDAIEVRYPEVGGITHSTIRLAVNYWARVAVARWQAASARDDLLIIEAPLIGGRLSSLTKPELDEAEAVLSSTRCLFVLPVPSREVKVALRAKRQASHAADGGASPDDAAVNVLDAHVAEINAAADALGLGHEGNDYDAELCAAVYLNAMRHREALRLNIDRLYNTASAGEEHGSHLSPLPEEVEAAFLYAEGVPEAIRAHGQSHWYR